MRFNYAIQLQRAKLPENNYRPGLAKKRFTGEIRRIHVVVFDGKNFEAVKLTLTAK